MNKQHNDMKILVIMMGKDKLHSSDPSSILGLNPRFDRLVDKVVVSILHIDKAMRKIIKENRCETVTVPNPSPRSEERKSSGSNDQDHTNKHKVHTSCDRYNSDKVQYRKK